MRALMKIQTSFAAITLASLVFAGTGIAQRMAVPPPSNEQLVIPPATNEWLTWGYDQERTGWNRAETTLSPKNVGQLKQLWSTQLSVPVDKYVLSTTTSPIVAAG